MSRQLEGSAFDAGESLAAPLLDSVLEVSAASQAVAQPRVDGVVLARLAGFAADGRPIVELPQRPGQAQHALALVALGPESIGKTCAVAFQGGDLSKPVVLGLLITGEQPRPSEVLIDRERVVLEAAEEIELRCGEAAIVLHADGRIQLRGTYITSHATATQRIVGGSVHVN